MPHVRNIPFSFVLAILFFTIGCIGSVGSWVTYRLDTGIARSGLKAEGHITGKDFLFSADGDSDYYVDYWFELPSGERVKASRGVGKEHWERLQKGQTLVVCYSAENPKRNFPEGAGVTSLGLTIYAFAFSMIFALFGALLIVAFLRSGRDEDASSCSPSTD